jgi:hypothetical protein
MYKKENYSAWDINFQDYFSLSSDIERMRFLVKFAVLAPSSHNSQPWYFSVHEKEIRVFKDSNRMLGIGDSNNRQLFISLGCAIENIVIAADYYGLDSIINYGNNDYVVAISFTKRNINTNDNNNHLIFNIPKRKVNRSKYLSKKIDESVFEIIQKYGDESLNINIISDKDKISHISDIALDATMSAMSNKNFRIELSKYIISNTSESKIGMPGFSMGFPTPISYIVPRILKLFNMSKLSKKQDELILKSTPYLVFISTENDEEKSWIKTGRVFQRMSLSLLPLGIYFSVWAAPIQIGKYYIRLQDILNINFRPQMFLRMGFPSKEMGGHSPRLKAADVLIN